ncbi:MAG: MoaD/ThiS family protein [Candidatus Sigynarchaeota archaeon]
MCAKVKLHLLNIFRLELKRQYIDMEANSIRDVLSTFEKEYLGKLPEYLKTKDQKHLTEHVLILLNGANVKNLDDSETALHDGDEIQLSVPIIGG